MENIKALALRMAREDGLVNLTCADLSAEAGFPEGSFTARTGITFTELAEMLVPMMRDCPLHTQQVNRRVHPAVRRDQIVKAALHVAQRKPYNMIKYSDVAEQAGVVRTLISHYFQHESYLITEMLKLAIEQEVLEVIKLGMVLRHPVITAAPAELKARANAI